MDLTEGNFPVMGHGNVCQAASKGSPAIVILTHYPSSPFSGFYYPIINLRLVVFKISLDSLESRGSQTFSDHAPLQHFDR